MLSSKWGIYVSPQPASLRLKDHPERRGRKNMGRNSEKCWELKYGKEFREMLSSAYDMAIKLTDS